MGLCCALAIAQAPLAFAAGTGADAVEDGGTHLLRQPALSQDRLAFLYAGDIWVSGRDGRDPRRLTADAAPKTAPRFSPDGKWIAYSATVDSNMDVYVVAADGGQPRRLTWHPDPDLVTGWSPDGRRVLFASPREVSNSRSAQLYEVPLEGGNERKVMEAVAVEGAWSPDGRRLAYRPTIKAYSGSSGWRQHRGGDTPPLWIIDPARGGVEEVPHVNASDSAPMWVGADLAFISDRNDGAANLFVYEAATHAVRQLTQEREWDVRSASACGGTIVYEAGGLLKTVDVAGGPARPLAVRLAAESTEARPQWKDASRTITSAMLSPTGKRVLVTARGDVFSVPVKDGSVRNLTATSGVRESDALWSADGLQVAYLSDEGGHTALLLRDAAGLEPPRRHALPAQGYFRLLAWSPDGQRLLLDDSHLHLYALELSGNELTLIDTSDRRGDFAPVFSADGRWIAYTVVRANHLTQLRLYGVAERRITELADSQTQTANPAFGDGVLYFTASIDAGPTVPGLDLSTRERPLRNAIFAAVLAADGKSPLAPRTGDEEPKKAKPPEKSGRPEKDGRDETPKPVRVDLAGLAQRIAPLPLAERNIDHLVAGADGALYYLVHRQPGSSRLPPKEEEEEVDAELFRFSFEERAEKSLRTGLSDLSASADRKKLLLAAGKGKLEVADAAEKLDAKPVDLSGLRVLVDPRAEWRQIFDETWRMEHEFFYDPNLHGLDWAAVRRRYEALLPWLARREDLNELLIEMIGELQVGHNRLRGGDIAAQRPSHAGLLGADLRVVDGRVRIARIYRGDPWSPFQGAPLAAPGLDVAEGDTLLAVNGRAVDAATNVFALFDGTLDAQTTLSVSRDGSAKAAHTAVVVPIASEHALRQWDWIERNRARVNERSGGKVAYVYLPDTAGQGFTYFNRMYFAQADRQALIVDDRRNSGGQAANYVLDVMARKFLAGWKDRDGLTFNTPGGAIYGPKVMLIDQDAGSGGDFLPYAFRRLGLGELIGTRTWGGLIGISANPDLIDGATLSVPYFRAYSPEGEWIVENEGVAPDLPVALDPVGVNQGRDSQLEAAIDEVLKALAHAPAVRDTAPPPPGHPGR
jgi:tricorn protease